MRMVENTSRIAALFCGYRTAKVEPMCGWVFQEKISLEDVKAAAAISGYSLMEWQKLLLEGASQSLRADASHVLGKIKRAYERSLLDQNPQKKLNNRWFTWSALIRMGADMGLKGVSGTTEKFDVVFETKIKYLRDDVLPTLVSYGQLKHRKEGSKEFWELSDM